MIDKKICWQQYPVTRGMTMSQTLADIEKPGDAIPNGAGATAILAAGVLLSFAPDQYQLVITLNMSGGWSALGHPQAEWNEREMLPCKVL